MDAALENYEYLSSLTAQMRTAAIQGEWDHLVDLEKQCSARIYLMRTLGDATPSDESTRLRKVELIRKILADDAEIRNQTQPWLGQLQHLMQSVVQERRLQEAYSGGH
ncbi:MAG: flagellar protein FliT [Nitrosomonadales bacterium]|nr:flagellar protein FliT [Nitrosomonadales bacterium]